MTKKTITPAELEDGSVRFLSDEPMTVGCVPMREYNVMYHGERRVLKIVGNELVDKLHQPLAHYGMVIHNQNFSFVFGLSIARVSSGIFSTQLAGVRPCLAETMAMGTAIKRVTSNDPSVR